MSTLKKQKYIFFTSIRIKLILRALLYIHYHLYEINQDILGYVHVSGYKKMDKEMENWDDFKFVFFFFFNSMTLKESINISVVVSIIFHHMGWIPQIHTDPIPLFPHMNLTYISGSKIYLIVCNGLCKIVYNSKMRKHLVFQFQLSNCLKIGHFIFKFGHLWAVYIPVASLPTTAQQNLLI